MIKTVEFIKIKFEVKNIVRQKYFLMIMPRKLKLSFTCLYCDNLENQYVKKRAIKSKRKLSIFVSLNSNSKNLIFLPNLNSKKLN